MEGESEGGGGEGSYMGGGGLEKGMKAFSFGFELVRRGGIASSRPHSPLVQYTVSWFCS